MPGNDQVDFYAHLTFRQYKDLEGACRAFAETEHGKGTEFYHKSIRLPIGASLVLELHGPQVMARGGCPHPINDVHDGHCSLCGERGLGGT